MKNDNKLKMFVGLCAHLINVINLKYLQSTSFSRLNVKCLHNLPPQYLDLKVKLEKTISGV